MKKIKVPYLDEEIKIDADEEFALRAMADGGCIIPVSDLVKGHGNWEKSVWGMYGFFEKWTRNEMEAKIEDKAHFESEVAEPDQNIAWSEIDDLFVKVSEWFESHPRRQVVVIANPFVVHSILSLIDKE